MDLEYKIFVSKLSELLTSKRDSPKSTVTSWVRTKVNFILIRSMLTCLRDSRSIKICKMAINDIDVLVHPTKDYREH